MIERVVLQPGAVDTLAPAQPASAVAWPAIAAGAVVSLALTLVLLAFGTGLGLSVVSPWSGSGVSATTFKIGTGLYLVVIAMLSSSIGGYIAGRLRTSWTVACGPAGLAFTATKSISEIRLMAFWPGRSLPSSARRCWRRPQAA